MIGGANLAELSEDTESDVSVILSEKEVIEENAMAAQALNDIVGGLMGTQTSLGTEEDTVN